MHLERRQQLLAHAWLGIDHQTSTGIYEGCTWSPIELNLSLVRPIFSAYCRHAFPAAETSAAVSGSKGCAPCGAIEEMKVAWGRVINPMTFVRVLFAFVAAMMIGGTV